MHKCSHKCKLSSYTYKLHQLKLLDSRVQILSPISLDKNCNKFNVSQQLLLLPTMETEVLLGYFLFIFFKGTLPISENILRHM